MNVQFLITNPIDFDAEVFACELNLLGQKKLIYCFAWFQVDSG